MSALVRPGLPIVATAGAVGLIQVVGTVGAAHNQPDRRPLDTLAVALVLAGPTALLGLRRAPLAVLATAFAIVAAYLGRGYAYGPVVVSAGVALVSAVQVVDRRRVWLVTALGLAAVTAGHALAPGERLTWWKPVAVAGWIGLLLAGAELVRARRTELRQTAVAAEQERQRRAGEVRLRVAQELHDTLAHTISLINVQASVALHLLDEQPEAGCGPRWSCCETVTAPPPPLPPASTTSTTWCGASRPPGWQSATAASRHLTGGSRPPRCSSPPTGSCRRR